MAQEDALVIDASLETTFIVRQCGESIVVCQDGNATRAVVVDKFDGFAAGDGSGSARRNYQACARSADSVLRAVLVEEVGLGSVGNEFCA